MRHPVLRPNMGIASLSIRDFRGIDRLDLDFRGPDGHPNSLVVLAGPNGCGKTTVLEAALILVGGHELITGRRGRPAVRWGAENYEILADVQFANGNIRLVTFRNFLGLPCIRSRTGTSRHCGPPHSSATLPQPSGGPTLGPRTRSGIHSRKSSNPW